MDLVVAALFFYVIPGMMAGAFSALLAEDGSFSIPPGSASAVCFTIGLFWPLAIAAGLSWLGFLCARSVYRGFVVLWRHWRPAERLPRAVAKEKL